MRCAPIACRHGGLFGGKTCGLQAPKNRQPACTFPCNVQDGRQQGLLCGTSLGTSSCRDRKLLAKFIVTGPADDARHSAHHQALGGVDGGALCMCRILYVVMPLEVPPHSSAGTAAAGERTVVMPTGGASGAMLNSKRRSRTARVTMDSNSANWSPAEHNRS